MVSRLSQYVNHANSGCIIQAVARHTRARLCAGTGGVGGCLGTRRTSRTEKGDMHQRLVIRNRGHVPEPDLLEGQH